MRDPIAQRLIGLLRFCVHLLFACCRFCGRILCRLRSMMAIVVCNGLGNSFGGESASVPEIQDIICDCRIGFVCIHGVLLMQGKARDLQAAVQGHRRVPSGLAGNSQRRRNGALRQAGLVTSIRLNHPDHEQPLSGSPCIQDSLIGCVSVVCLVLISRPGTRPATGRRLTFPTMLGPDDKLLACALLRVRKSAS